MTNSITPRPSVPVRLRPVDLSNREDLELIEPGVDAAGWVHSNWYWHQVSLERHDIDFRLIHVATGDRAVGMVAYGPAYSDEALLHRVPGRYELAHLVVDHRWHRRGIGRTTAGAVLAMMAAQPDCAQLIVAHHPANEASRLLFTSLGLRPIDERNYDGDPILAADPASWTAQACTRSSSG